MNDLPPAPAEVDLACPECDYNLTGATGDRCPWCGWKIDPGELAAEGAQQPARRWTVVASSVVVAVGTMWAVLALVQRGRRVSLTLADGVGALAILSGVGGHLLLAGAAALHKARWPMRRGEVSSIVLFVALLSMIAAVAGATQALDFAPTPLFNSRGFRVNGVAEFVLMGALFALPGLLLLILRLVAFRPRRGRRSPEAASREALTAAGAPFFIEVEGRYAPDAVIVTGGGASRAVLPEVERLIAQTWEAELAVAGGTQRLLYDGPLVRLVALECDPGPLRLLTGETTYREFLGTNLYNAPAVLRAGPQYLADALGVSAAAITSDGYMALGRRAARVAFYPGYVHPFGGMLEPADAAGAGAYDVFVCAARELAEELGVARGDIREMHLAGLVRDRRIHQPELLVEAMLTLTRAELQAQFDPAASDGEHQILELVFEEPEGFLAAMERWRPITPVAQATLLLRGRHLWGESWYEDACFRLYGELPAVVRPPQARSHSE
ncbi:MAG: hypothetical protein HY763_02485 [Planctomycetes bacterium]|nr:hypothetical protein [Planctomycetota bacterium]